MYLSLCKWLCGVLNLFFVMISCSKNIYLSDCENYRFYLMSNKCFSVHSDVPIDMSLLVHLINIQLRCCWIGTVHCCSVSIRINYGRLVCVFFILCASLFLLAQACVFFEGFVIIIIMSCMALFNLRTDIFEWVCELYQLVVEFWV